MTQNIYERLADHLDSLPAGFPRTPEGVEFRILKRLFSEDEAELACHLSVIPEGPESIAAKVGQPVELVAPKLAEMSKKGLIFRMNRRGETQYMASQFVIGIWEFHVNDLDEDLIRDMNAYIPHLIKEFTKIETQQLRTIPISKSLPGEGAVMPYEEARQIVEAQSKIIVADCICRKEHKMVSKGCDRPMESCLVFGTGANFYLENGLGREISKDEALKILENAEEFGLVLQPSNAQKVVNICLCCGCCCQVLKGLKLQEKPARHVNSNFYADVDEERCAGCETCLERCQMEAIQMVDGVANVNLDRCIGCGLCVPTCSTEAIHLVRQPEEARRVPPANMIETYMRIANERGRDMG
jgi:Pyruvate/2-oxoacid:ferredoxin oxidoreductase delta subunit